MKRVAISGGFDPIHIGHIKLIQEARKLGDSLVVIINNDIWLKKKKGFVFMNEQERKEIILELESVSGVIITSHKSNDEDMSVCKELKSMRPKVFANGGDRKAGNIPEYKFCDDNEIEMVFNVGGGKIQSSSELVKAQKKNF